MVRVMTMPSLAAAEAEWAYQAQMSKMAGPAPPTSLYVVTKPYRFLLVEAASLDQAVGLWRRHFDLGECVRPDSVFAVPAITGRPRALSWFEDVPELTWDRVCEHLEDDETGDRPSSPRRP
jgi:hypothetical protein